MGTIPTLVQQLQFIVKNPTVGKPATFAKVDSVIRETKSLMEAVNRVVTATLSCRQHVSSPPPPSCTLLSCLTCEPCHRSCQPCGRYSYKLSICYCIVGRSFVTGPAITAERRQLATDMEPLSDTVLTTTTTSSLPHHLSNHTSMELTTVQHGHSLDAQADQNPVALLSRRQRLRV